MNTSQEIFVEEMNLLKQDLIQKYDDLGMRASGKWADNLEVFFDLKVDKYIAQIIGLDYTEQLVQGREPGRFPPISSIVDWINDKPITPNDNISIESLAFLIARKIANEGTEYFKQGGTDLVEAVITKERVQKIINKVGNLLVNNFELEINPILNRISQ